ncbi:hypothetical protein RPHASCH2410_CH20990 [Rhizobium phaseoli Ch24-10]|nr:hypothetical protein RPHASCH2410_CH20990 [Rhizobium phaseoli Ch24-10]
MPFGHNHSSILLEVAADRHGRQIHSVQQEIRKLEAQSRRLDTAGAVARRQHRPISSRDQVELIELLGDTVSPIHSTCGRLS